MLSLVVWLKDMNQLTGYKIRVGLGVISLKTPINPKQKLIS
jgi:hypothetical protein